MKLGCIELSSPMQPYAARTPTEYPTYPPRGFSRSRACTSQLALQLASPMHGCDHLLSVRLSVHRLVCASVRVRSPYTSVAALGTMARNSRDLLVVLFEAPSSEIEDRGRSPSGHVTATRCKYSVATAARAARDQHARQPLVLGGLVQYPKAAETARCGCTSASCCELARLLRAVAARGQRPCYRARAAAATPRDQGGMYAEPWSGQNCPRAVLPSAHRFLLPPWADKHHRCPRHCSSHCTTVSALVALTPDASI